MNYENIGAAAIDAAAKADRNPARLASAAGLVPYSDNWKAFVDGAMAAARKY